MFKLLQVCHQVGNNPREELLPHTMIILEKFSKLDRSSHQLQKPEEKLQDQNHLLQALKRDQLCLLPLRIVREPPYFLKETATFILCTISLTKTTNIYDLQEQ